MLTSLHPKNMFPSSHVTNSTQLQAEGEVATFSDQMLHYIIG